jgi:hypothetical protein
MKALQQFKLPAGAIDIAATARGVVILDAKMGLTRLELPGGRPKRMALLKQPPKRSLTSQEAALIGGGEVVFAQGSHIYYFNPQQAVGKQGFQAAAGKITRIVRHKEGRRLALVDSEGFVSIASLDYNRLYSFIPFTLRHIQSLFFCPEGRWLFVGESGNKALIFDLLTHRVVARFELPEAVSGGCFLRRGILALSGAKGDLFLISWHREGVLLKHLPLPQAVENAFLRSADVLLIGLRSGSLAAINLKDNRLMRIWPLLEAPITLLKRRGDWIVAGDSGGAVAVFDLMEGQEALHSAMAEDRYHSAKAAVDENPFLLLDEAVGPFFDQAWQERVFPAILTRLEQGQEDIAQKLAADFIDQPERERAYRQACALSKPLRALRRAVKAHHYDEACELLDQHPLLHKSRSGQLYEESWQSAFSGALEALKDGDYGGAKQALEHFLTVGHYHDLLNHLLRFPKLFIKAQMLYEKGAIEPFYTLLERHPILKSIPASRALDHKAGKLQRALLEAAQSGHAAHELELAKKLSAYPAFLPRARELSHRASLQLHFAQAVEKGQMAEAYELAFKHPALCDEPLFLTLYMPYQERFNHALEAALEGDSQSVLTLTSEAFKTPLLRDGIALLFRIAYSERFKHVVVPGAVNWPRSFDNYTRLLGYDPFVALAATAVEQQETLAFFKGRSDLRGYIHTPFDPEAIVHQPLESLSERSRRLPLLQALTAVIVLVLLLAGALLIERLFEGPMDEYREKIIKESPYKLFERLGAPATD